MHVCLEICLQNQCVTCLHGHTVSKEGNHKPAGPQLGWNSESMQQLQGRLGRAGLGSGPRHLDSGIFIAKKGVQHRSAPEVCV